ncbi:hypothetical protein DPMN_026681 [Dreissena polymorpha]|uniref:Uncharacterized protein n=1 Tax=Dreissena polymorpha TaxID=45954 RepID=A0A9D4LTF1_DREPO|nr:hypothetical protein DPMN_026681 [Dreissena polymorpha]
MDRGSTGKSHFFPVPPRLKPVNSQAEFRSTRTGYGYPGQAPVVAGSAPVKAGSVTAEPRYTVTPPALTVSIPASDPGRATATPRFHPGRRRYFKSSGYEDEPVNKKQRVSGCKDSDHDSNKHNETHSPMSAAEAFTQAQEEYSELLREKRKTMMKDNICKTFSNGDDLTEDINSSNDPVMSAGSSGTEGITSTSLAGDTPERTSRRLDPQHVDELVDSFKSGNQFKSENQFTTLVGKVKVEILGGNHNREALQRLLRDATALMMGYQHNTSLEKQKRLTFIDKVRLMRKVLPPMPLAPADKKAWKEQLSIIFQMKDIRRFQQTYGLHLQMAQLEQNVWDIVEHVSNSGLTISEKFF